MTLVSNERSLWLGQHVLPHEPALRSWLIGRRLFGVDVDDIIQETYTRLMSIENVQHIRNTKNYTFQIAASVVADQMRRMKVVPIASVANLDQLEIVSDEPSPEHQAIDRDELAQLAKAIAALPNKIRQVFTLRRIQGLSQREVATTMGIAESTVEKHMSKGFLLILNQRLYGGNPPADTSSPRPAKVKVQLAHVKKDRA